MKISNRYYDVNEDGMEEITIFYAINWFEKMVGKPEVKTFELWPLGFWINKETMNKASPKLTEDLNYWKNHFQRTGTNTDAIFP